MDTPAGLLAWMEVPRRHAAAFDAWYTFEHVGERVAIAGFLRATRYRRVPDDDPATVRYFTLYDVENEAVFASPEYLDRLENPSPWTREIVPISTLRWRIAAPLRAALGAGRSGTALVVEWTADSDARLPLLDHLRTLHAAHDVVAARIYEADPAASATRDATAEARASGAGAESPPHTVAIVELPQGANPDAVAHGIRAGSSCDRITTVELIYDLVRPEPAAASLPAPDQRLATTRGDQKGSKK